MARQYCTEFYLVHTEHKLHATALRKIKLHLLRRAERDCNPRLATVSGLTLNPQLSVLTTTSSLKTRRCFKEHHQTRLGTPSLVLASRLPAGPNQVPQTHLVADAEV